MSSLNVKYNQAYLCSDPENLGQQVHDGNLVGGALVHDALHVLFQYWEEIAD